MAGGAIGNTGNVWFGRGTGSQVVGLSDKDVGKAREDEKGETMMWDGGELNQSHIKGPPLIGK